jgi:dUTP pyrophosphatase
VIGVGPLERIAQAVVLPLPRVFFEESVELEKTERGAGGFGSTGVK